MAVTGKQAAFVDQYLVDFNATRAAERAGYEGNENALAVTGNRLLRNVKISELIKARLNDRAMTADEVLTRLAEQARGNMNDFVRFDNNGNPTFDLQAASMMGKLSLAKKLKVKTRSYNEVFYNATINDLDSREVTETAIEFELYDAQAALAHLGKHHGLFKDVTEVEHRWIIEIGNLLKQGKVTPKEVEEELGRDLARELFESIGLATATSQETQTQS